MSRAFIWLIKGILLDDRGDYRDDDDDNGGDDDDETGLFNVLPGKGKQFRCQSYITVVISCCV